MAQIGDKIVSADLTAQVLGKTGSLLGRFIARIRLSISLGEWVSRESLGKKIPDMTPETLQRIWTAYTKAARSQEQTCQILALHTALDKGKTLLPHPEDEGIAAKAQKALAPSPLLVAPPPADMSDPFKELLATTKEANVFVPTSDCPLPFSWQGKACNVWVNVHKGVTVEVMNGPNQWCQVSLSADGQKIFYKDKGAEDSYDCTSQEGRGLLQRYTEFVQAATTAIKEVRAISPQPPIASSFTEDKGRELLAHLQKLQATRDSSLSFTLPGGVSGHAWVNAGQGVTVQIAETGGAKISIKNTGEVYYSGFSGSQTNLALKKIMADRSEMLSAALEEARRKVAQLAPSPLKIPLAPSLPPLIPSPPETPYPFMLEREIRQEFIGSMNLLSTVFNVSRNWALPFDFQGQPGSVWINQYGGVTVRIMKGPAQFRQLSFSSDGSQLFDGNNQYLIDDLPQGNARDVLMKYSPVLCAAMEAVKEAFQDKALLPPVPLQFTEANGRELFDHLQALRGTGVDYVPFNLLGGLTGYATLNQYGGVSVEIQNTGEGVSLRSSGKIFYWGNFNTKTRRILERVVNSHSEMLHAALTQARQLRIQTKAMPVAIPTPPEAFGAEDRNALQALLQGKYRFNRRLPFECDGVKGEVWANTHNGVTIVYQGKKISYDQEGAVYVKESLTPLSEVDGKMVLSQNAPALQAALQAAHQSALVGGGSVVQGAQALGELYYAKPAQSTIPPPKNVTPFNVPLTVAISLMMLDRNVKGSDAQRALSLRYDPQYPGSWLFVRGKDKNLHLPLVKAKKVPHQSIQGLEIVIPKERPDIRQRLTELGFEVQGNDPEFPNYPWKCSLDQQQMDVLLKQLDIPLAEIHKARPTEVAVGELKNSKGWEGALAVKGWEEEDILDIPVVKKEHVIALFSKWAPSLEKAVQAMWAEAETSGEAGQQAICIFKAIVDKLANKQEMAEADQRLFADINQAMGLACFAARYTELESAYRTWQSSQAGKGGANELVRILISQAIAFKEALVAGIVLKSPQSIHCANYLKQRWANLFGFKAEPDHAAYQGPGILQALGLEERTAAQSFVALYTAQDLGSPYPNKSVLFKELYEKLLATELTKGKPIWIDSEFQGALRPVAGPGLTYYLLKMKKYISSGLRPEGAELYFISLGLLPGNVEEKKAELMKKMEQEVILESTPLWTEEVKKGDGADKQRLFDDLEELAQLLSEEQIAKFLQSVGIADGSALEKLLGKEKFEALTFSFPEVQAEKVEPAVVADEMPQAAPLPTPPEGSPMLVPEVRADFVGSISALKPVIPLDRQHPLTFIFNGASCAVWKNQHGGISLFYQLDKDRGILSLSADAKNLFCEDWVNRKKEELLIDDPRAREILSKYSPVLCAAMNAAKNVLSPANPQQMPQLPFTHEERMRLGGLLTALKFSSDRCLSFVTKEGLYASAWARPPETGGGFIVQSPSGAYVSFTREGEIFYPGKASSPLAKQILQKIAVDNIEVLKGALQAAELAYASAPAAVAQPGPEQMPLAQDETIVSERTFPIDGALKKAFSVRSATIQAADSGPETGILDRWYYLDAHSPIPPVVIGKSSFVSDDLLNFIMTNKTDGDGYTVKFNPEGLDSNPDHGIVNNFGPCMITPMEGCMHTYATPIVGDVRMCGDYYYEKGHCHVNFGGNQYRQVILSAAIHPDCEVADPVPPHQGVFVPLVEIGESVEGLNVSPPVLSLSDRHDPEKVANYDRQLLQRQIYSLTSRNRRISREEVTKQYDITEAEKRVEGLIKAGKSREEIQGELRTEAILLNGRLISMEILYNSYIEQLQNELFTCEQLTGEEGYVYTIDPPRIFAGQLGDDGAHALNLFQCLALKTLQPSLRKLKRIGMGGAPDEQQAKIIELYNIRTKDLAMKKTEMQDPDTHLLRQGVIGNAALILHNNSDAFYQNIRYEAAGGSLDGEIGECCNACLALLPKTNPDIHRRVITYVRKKALPAH